MEIAAAYIRVSTNDQLEFSPDAQRKAIQCYAKSNNLILKENFIFIDEGISGKTAKKRPQFMKMINTAKQIPRPFDVILVHKFDRFARNREDSIVYKSILRKQCGIKVISVTEHIENDKISIILESMLEAMAEYYSINLSEEVKKGMTEKALKGEFQSCPPLGYKLKNKSKCLEIIPKEAEYIKFIFNEFINGTSILSIARKLNQLGATTKHGNLIESRTVKYILSNPIYAGYTKWTLNKSSNDYDIIIKKSTHTPIISEEAFKLVQDKLKNQRLNHIYKQRPCEEYKHWLSSLIKCSNCGASLVKSSKKGFQCSNYTKGKCFESHYLSIRKVENAVIEEIKKILLLNEFDKFKINNTNSKEYTNEINFINKEINLLNKKILRAKEAFLSGVDYISEYMETKKTIQEKIINLKSKLNYYEQNNYSNKKYENKILNIENIFDENISNLDKNKALKSILEKIVYDKKNNKLIFYFFY